MVEVLKNKQIGNYDSCIVAIPKEFAQAHGFPAKCFAMLTWRDGKLSSEIMEYFDEDEKEVAEFLAAFPNLKEELKQSDG